MTPADKFSFGHYVGAVVLAIVQLAAYFGGVAYIVHLARRWWQRNNLNDHIDAALAPVDLNVYRARKAHPAGKGATVPRQLRGGR